MRAGLEPVLERVELEPDELAFGLELKSAALVVLAAPAAPAEPADSALDFSAFPDAFEPHKPAASALADSTLFVVLSYFEG